MTHSTSFALNPECMSNDDHLADAIEADARTLIASGLEVSIGRYMSAIPDLASRPLAADAAVEFVLRSASQRGIAEELTAHAIAATAPSLAMAVHRAVLLNQWCGASSASDAASAKPPPLTLPSELGPVQSNGRRRYELREKLGEGTQGAVYLAHDRALSDSDRLALVAIKRHGDLSTLEWSEDEATRARRVIHPNVVRVLDRGVSQDGWPFMVMEYMDGGSFDSPTVRSRCRASTSAALTLTAQVADGVHAAHLAGLVHCDLKPGNVLLTREGVPKATDFGLSSRIARASLQDGAGGGPTGSWGFSAPELLRGEPGARAIPADVYGLSGLLFSLLTDHSPNGDSVDESRAWASSDHPEMHERRRLLLRGVPPDVQAVILKSLAWHPRNRHGSAESFAADLRAVLNHHPLEWTRPTLWRRAGLFARRRPAVAAVGVTAVIAAMLATGVVARVDAQAEARLLSEQLAASQDLRDEQDRRIEQDARDRKTLLGVVNLSARSITANVKKEFNEVAWSPTLLIMEPVLGPHLASQHSDVPKQDWYPLGAQVGRLELDKLERAGQGQSMEALLWRDSIAFWSLRIEDHQTALSMLDEGQTAADRLLATTDRWSIVRRSLRLVAEAQRCGACDAETRRALLMRLQSVRDELGVFGRAGGLISLVEKAMELLGQPQAGRPSDSHGSDHVTTVGTRHSSHR